MKQINGFGSSAMAKHSGPRTARDNGYLPNRQRRWIGLSLAPHRFWHKQLGSCGYALQTNGSDESRGGRWHKLFAASALINIATG